MILETLVSFTCLLSPSIFCTLKVQFKKPTLAGNLLQVNLYVLSLKVFELVSNGLSIDFKCVARWTNLELQARGSAHGGCHYVKQTYGLKFFIFLSKAGIVEI